MGKINREDYVTAIESELQNLMPEKDCLQKELYRAMRYSLLAGGKRIRPVLVLEFCGLCGGNQEAALPFACAVEMVHTYSLIHDDLPCMDNDSLRRGKPSNHIIFGEAQAMLAGDALQAAAFEAMLSPESVQGAGASKAAEAAGILAHAAGADGMAGGQEIDLACVGEKITMKTLQKMDELKTGAMIRAAATMGCVLAGASKVLVHAADEYAAAVGFAFQIVDDILDVEGDAKALGKPVGSDQQNDKRTYVSLLGMENAKHAVAELTETAVKALDAFHGDTGYLVDIAQKLASRRN